MRSADAGPLLLDARPPESSLSDAGTDDAGTVEIPPWLLTASFSRETDALQLLRVSIEPASLGQTMVICPAVTLPPGQPPAFGLASIAFHRDVLYASGRGEVGNDSLLTIDPCTCTASLVGPYGPTSLTAISSGGGQEMFGVSSEEDALFTIDPTTGAATLLGPLGFDWDTTGLSSAGPGTMALWGLEGTTNQLVSLSTSDGSVLRTQLLDFDFVGVGVEHHAGVEQLFACSGTGELLVINPIDGHVTVGPETGVSGCKNLAAPFGPVRWIP